MSVFNTIVLCLSHYSGGMELDSIKMVKGLKENKKSCLLVCKKDSFISNLARENNINYEEISFKRKFSLNIILKLRKKIKNYHTKNLIFLGTSEIKSIYFSLLGMPDINLIVRYGTTMSTSKKNPLHKLFYSRVNTHITISKHLEKNIKKIIPIAKKSLTTVIYTSTNFLPYHESKIINQAVHVGRVIPQKGQLEAIESVLGTNINLKIVGSIEDNNYFRVLSTYIKKKDIENKIDFTGFCNNPQYIVKNSSLFIFPSYGEGLSNALVEALGHGLICITYDNTVFPEFKSLGFNLHLVSNKEQLRKTVTEVMENYTFEMRKARANVALAREFFSSKREFTELSNYLR